MAARDEVVSGSAPRVLGLRRDAIGLREVLFQSITDMAPGAAIAASIPAGALYAGGALPLSVLVALVACLLSASCIGLLARELPSAGSLAGAVIILAAGFYGIRTSARLGTILGTTEIAVFGVLAVLFVMHAGHANTASVFTTKYTPRGSAASPG